MPETNAPATPAAPTTPAATAENKPAIDAKTAANKSATPAPKVDENGVAADPAKKVWKLNINGKEVEYDATDEERIKRDVQKVFGIEEKAKSTAQKINAAETLLTMIKDDPKGFVKQCKALGLDADKLATDILWQQIKYKEMTPEQRELEEYKEREAEAKAKAEAEAATAKEAEEKKKVDEWTQKFEKDCQAAFDANKIPKTRLSLALVANYMDSGLANKQEFTVEQVLPYVARDLKEIHRSTMESLDGDDLLNYVGEALSNKIAKARVERYKRSTSNQPQKGGQQQGSTPKSVAERLKGLKGKAYWRALRQIKSEEGIGMFPAAPGNP